MTAPSKRRRRETLAKLRGFEPLTLGQRVWFLCAKECEGCEDSKEPIVDPRSFSWIEGKVTGAVYTDDDGLTVAPVTQPDEGEGLFERRFVVTENEARLLQIPLPEVCRKNT